MTAERLARLLAWSDTQAYVYGDGVKRLAQEREALLGSLKAILPDGGKYEPWKGASTLKIELSMTSDEYREFQAALAKAEAP